MFTGDQCQHPGGIFTEFGGESQRLQPEFGVCLEEFLHHALILPPHQGAGGVDQHAAGADIAGLVLEDLKLQFGQLLHRIRILFPDVGLFADDYLQNIQIRLEDLNQKKKTIRRKMRKHPDRADLSFHRPIGKKDSEKTSESEAPIAVNPSFPSPELDVSNCPGYVFMEENHWDEKANIEGDDDEHGGYFKYFYDIKRHLNST